MSLKKKSQKVYAEASLKYHIIDNIKILSEFKWFSLAERDLKVLLS